MAWDKLRLENVLYACAAREQQFLGFVRGHLCVARGSSLLLKMLAAVYNQFFAAENQQFAAEDMEDTAHAEQNVYRQFMAARRLHPLLPGFHLISRHDVKSDL